MYAAKQLEHHFDSTDEFGGRFVPSTPLHVPVWRLMAGGPEFLVRLMLANLAPGLGLKGNFVFGAGGVLGI
jgi:hypothetical protein